MVTIRGISPVMTLCLALTLVVGCAHMHDPYADVWNNGFFGPVAGPELKILDQ